MDKLRILAGILLGIVAFAVFAKAPQAVTSLQDALDKAKKDNKMLFVQYGREACGNCKALRELISKGKVKLPEDKYVYADVNCDDKETDQLFESKFKVSGETLPFVVITDAEGNQLASRSGYGDEKEFAKFIKDAEGKAKNGAARKNAADPVKAK